MTSANLPLAKEIFPIIKVLHEASIIYLDYYRQNSQKIYFWKDSNFQELRSLVRQYQVLRNPKNYEFDVELAIKNKQHILKHRDDEILKQNALLCNFNIEVQPLRKRSRKAKRDVKIAFSKSKKYENGLRTHLGRGT